MLWLAVVVALMLSGAMALAWRVALTTGQSGRIDAIWAFATGSAAVVAAAASAGRPPAADRGLRDGRDSGRSGSGSTSGGARSAAPMTRATRL